MLHNYMRTRMRALFYFFFSILLNQHFSFTMTLEQRWTYEKIGFGSKLNPDLLKGKHVVFIAGIMNELSSIISNYYDDNIETVKELGASVSYYGPSSQKSIPYNAYLLHQKILKLHHELQKPLILIGHSKGGAELLYMTLKYPELVYDQIVEKVVLIQSAIGGSPLAKNNCTWCIDLISVITKPNLITLNEETAKTNFNRAFRLFDLALLKLAKERQLPNLAKIRRNISNRIFYVRSQENPNRLSLGVRLVLGICNENLGPSKANDGLLFVSAQMDPRIGTDLGILQADHIDLTVSSISNTTRYERRAFTRVLFEHIAFTNI